MTLAAMPTRHTPGPVTGLRPEYADLTDPALLAAVRALRQTADTAVFYAACDRVDTPHAAEEIERRWRVSHEAVSRIEQSIRRVTAHGLDPEHVAAFGDALLPDGTVIVVAAAGLDADEIAALVRGRVRLDVAALAAAAARRGYRLPPTGAQARSVA